MQTVTAGESLPPKGCRRQLTGVVNGQAHDHSNTVPHKTMISTVQPCREDVEASVVGAVKPEEKSGERKGGIRLGVFNF